MTHPTTRDQPEATTGSCLCGKIRLRIEALNRDVVYCHCSQCRKQSGHYFAAANVNDEKLQISGVEHITWYAASDSARRGFCGCCGSVLFWKANGGNHTSVLAGCLDQPTGLKAIAHIYTSDKGDYYDISDGLKTWPQAD